MSDVVEIEQVGAVRLVRLNRPDRKNALTSELGWAIIEAVRAVATDDEVRVVGITGNGDAFSSWLDFGPAEPASPLTGTAQLIDDLGWVGRFPGSTQPVWTSAALLSTPSTSATLT
ncbi:MAG: enoyl-CoA hydratase-related protein [Acidimicrobiales bacterium]|jgi:2-(1,2-epoxy-1,2-dihydrophenyl)acetyl-CoA isomerase|nr:enoyl-CoA hydratase-related protein [Acidimicrobiales bacterium]